MGDDRKAPWHPLTLTWVQSALILSRESSASTTDGEGDNQEERDCCSSSENGAVAWASQQPGSFSFPISALMGLGLTAGRTFAREQSSHHRSSLSEGLLTTAKFCSCSTSGGWGVCKEKVQHVLAEGASTQTAA